jgi:tRNA nucleotidyltransferase (CCA-adding enzyme)
VETFIPEFLNAAAALFESNGTSLYLVGGWPRNRLLGLPPGDLDISSALPPSEAATLFSCVPGVRVIERDTRLGTLGVLCGGTQAEYTAFRTESYGAGGAHRPDEVQFGATMLQDALRRDFTANALYHNIATGKDEDPLGGLADVAAKLLRTCRTPQETFADDGLRLMRLVRFAAELGFAIEPETALAAKANAALLLDIAPERVQAELNKILLCDTRYPAMAYAASPVLTGLELLDSLGLLECIAPEFGAARGVVQRADYHDHDVLEHLLHTCACSPSELPLRLAALLHDIGKPAAIEQSGRMLGHDKLGEGMAAAILRRLRYPHATVAEVSVLVRRHMYDLDGRTGAKRLRLFFAQMGRERAWKLVALRRADICGSKTEQAAGDPAEKWVRLLEQMDRENVPWTEQALAVSGTDLVQLAGGPQPLVGALKQALHEHAVLHPKDNNRETLLRLASQLIADKQRFTGR